MVGDSTEAAEAFAAAFLSSSLLNPIKQICIQSPLQMPPN